MNRHFTAEALLRCRNGAAGFCGRFLRFFRGFFFLLFRGFLRGFRRCRALSGRGAVDCLQGRFGGDGRAGQGLDPVLAEGEGAALADELVGKRRFGSPLAQAHGLVRRIDGQGLHFIAVQGDVNRHFTAEALLRCRNGAAGFCGRFLRFFRGFFFLLFRGFLRGFRRCRVLSGHGTVDRLQGRVGGDGRAGQRFDPVLAEGEGAALADKLLCEFRIRGPFSQAFGLIRRIDRQLADDSVLCHSPRGHFAAEALLRGFRGGGRAAGRRGVVRQRSVSGQHAGHRQHRDPHQHRAHRDPDPLLLLKIIHICSSVQLYRSRHDDFGRALFRALAAERTFVRIDPGQRAVKLDGFGFALFDAQAAADAAR